MSTDETSGQRDSAGRSEGTERYNGWTNRETWAVALHINNDQGWQESVLDALREERDRLTVRGEDDGIPERVEGDTLSAWYAGEIIRESVEETLDPDNHDWASDGDIAAWWLANIRPVVTDIGSLWRVDWRELGAAFLADLDEERS